MTDKSDDYARVSFKSLCRSYDLANVKTLANWAYNENVEPHIRIEAIKVLFDRGHGRPKTKTTHKGPAADGSHTFVVRMIHEGKPKGEK